MKKIYYYSLLLALAAQSVTYTSCKNDDNEDEITPSNNTEQSSEQNKEQSSEQNKNVEKFTVTINLNENPLPLVYTEEKGKTININIDELLKNESIKDYLKAYEIFSITENGKEIKDNITFNGDAKIEITALKHADIKMQFPNEEGKILYRKEELKSGDLESEEYWMYTTKENELYTLIRQNKEENYANAKKQIYKYDSENEKFYHLRYNGDRQYDGYFIKNGDKYYQTTLYRLVKKDNTVKGYQTEWIEEGTNDAKSIKKDGLVDIEPQVSDNITITADKFNDSEYEYKDGIITLENGNKYIYDGTYLYEIYYEYSLIDYTNPFKSDELLEYKDVRVEGYGTEISEIENIYTEANRIPNTNIYEVYENGAKNLYGIYNWDGDNIITYGEAKSWIYEFNTYPFGILNNMIAIFPDGKVIYNDILMDYIENSAIIYENKYIVINASRYYHEG